jgi:hypothetical protein
MKKATSGSLVKVGVSLLSSFLSCQINIVCSGFREICADVSVFASTFEILNCKRSSIINECKLFASSYGIDGRHGPGRIGVAYFYFDFREQSKQHTCNMLLTLIRQLASTDEYLDRVKELMDQFPIQVHIPISNMIDMLLDLAKDFDRVILLLDALDGCENVPKLFEALNAILLDKIQILVSSRDEISLQQALENMSYERHPLAVHSIRQDLESYIHEQVVVDSTHRFARFPESVKTDIVTQLSSHSQGM